MAHFLKKRKDKVKKSNGPIENKILPFVLIGVALVGFEDTLLENHLKEMKQLVQRDKNRPSVVMWSLANEPRCQHH